MRYIVDDSKIEKTLNKLDKPIKSAYSAWKSILTNNGFDGLRKVKGFHLEKFKGKRKDQYTCRLNRGFRVFFKKADNVFIITVLEINKHDY